MKKLLIVRHAKSSWDNLYVSDFDRPLNERGQRDAPMMAQEMKKIGLCPQAIYTSTANRALKTATYFKEIMDIDNSNFHEDNSLYHAMVENIMSVINNMDDKYSFASIFGHNPGISEVVSTLTNDPKYFEMPTNGVCYFEFNTDKWNKCTSKNATVKGFYYPKMY